MHIWKVSKVVERLRAGLSEREQTQYFAAFFLLIILGLNFPIDSDARGWVGYYGFPKWLAYCTIAIAGAFAAYRTNWRGDGKAFSARFVALFVPLTLQSLGIVGLGLIAASAAPGYLSESTITALYASSFWDWFWFWLQMFSEGVLFVRLTVNMRRVSGIRNVG